MTISRYFKTELDQRVIWVEFEGEYPTRQIEYFAGHWFNSVDEPTRICDQPLRNMDPEIYDDEISKREFEAAWNEAMSRRPSPETPS